MVADTVLVALVSGGLVFAASGLQAYINRLNTKDQLNAETNRRKGELYLREKVDALVHYHSKLEEAIEEIVIYRDRASLFGDLSEEEFDEEVSELYNSYHRALTSAAVFLTEEQHETINDTLQPLRDACRYVGTKVDNPNTNKPDWPAAKLSKTFDDARDLVRNEIHEGLKSFEDE